MSDFNYFFSVKQVMFSYIKINKDINEYTPKNSMMVEVEKERNIFLEKRRQVLETLPSNAEFNEIIEENPEINLRRWNLYWN